MNKSIGLILGIAAFIALLLIPIDPEVLPTAARYAAAVTVLMAIFWITQPIPIEATSLIPIVAFPLLGILTPAEACAPYADKVIFLFLGGFIIAMSMQRWGLHKRIALKIIEFTGRNCIFVNVDVQYGYRNDDGANRNCDHCNGASNQGLQRYVRRAQSIRRMYCSCSCLCGKYRRNCDTDRNSCKPAVDFFTWLKFGIPLLLIFIPVTWAWLTHVAYRKMPKTLEHAKEALATEVAALGPMSRGEKNTLAVFLLTAFLWIFEKNKDFGTFTIPGLEMIFPGIDDCTVAIFGALLLFLLPVNWKKQEFTMNWQWAVRIPWGILLLFGGGMCLSAAFIESGLAQATCPGNCGLFHGVKRCAGCSPDSDSCAGGLFPDRGYIKYSYRIGNDADSCGNRSVTWH